MVIEGEDKSCDAHEFPQVQQPSIGFSEMFKINKPFFQYFDYLTVQYFCFLVYYLKQLKNPLRCITKCNSHVLKFQNSINTQ